MPLYKKTHKKAAQRVIPFDLNAESYPELLQYAFVILKSLKIQEYSKLDLEYAPN